MNFQPVPVCNCGGMKIWIYYQQQEHVMQFFMELNEALAIARGQILMLDPLPPVAKVFNLIIQEERQRMISPSPPILAESLAFTVPFTPSSVAAVSTHNKPKSD